MKQVLFIFRYLKPYKIHIVSLILFLIIFSLLNTLLPYLTFTVTIDRLLPQSDFKMILFIAGIILACVLAMTFIQYLQGYLMSYMGSRISFDIRQHLLRHLQRLSLKFFANRHSGEILERLNTDVEGIQRTLTNELVTIVSSVFQVAFLTVAIFILNWQLALLIVFLVSLQTLFLAYAIKRLHKRIHDFRQSQSDLIGILQERISLIKVIQAFVKQTFESRRHHDDSMKIIDQGLEIANIRAKMFGLFFLFLDLIPLGVLWLGSVFLVTEQVSLGALLTMWAYATNYLMPIRGIVMGITHLQESVVGIQRVKAYFDQIPEIKEVDRPIRDSIVNGDIEFLHVDFAYEPDKPVLHDISFRVRPGQTVAFVGESGSGKSTVTNLVFRFYDPVSGQITLDGRVLPEYGLRHLRKHIGVVFQETELFVATLRENLTYGVFGRIDDGEIMEAVRMSLLEEVVAQLPNGLDTMLEERGTNFSGGEKQRIAICRLILKRPSIVVFDEATSALDSASEKLIQATIERVMEEPTSILIAHRLSTVIHADNIIVLKDGRIVEQGRHEELLERDGEYRLLWDEQQKDEAGKWKELEVGG